MHVNIPQSVVVGDKSAVVYEVNIAQSTVTHFLSLMLRPFTAQYYTPLKPNVRERNSHVKGLRQSIKRDVQA